MTDTTIDTATQERLDVQQTRINTMVEQLAQTQNELAGVRAQLRECETDWNTLNAFLNQYAEDTDMCNEYENRLHTWNEDFSRLKLEGRYKSYSVRTRVEMTYYVNVEVEAKSSEDAIDSVDNMEISDVIENIDSIHDWEDYTIDAKSAEPVE